ncbi:molecular chaperone [Pseudomonas sp. CCI3.2]|uniref:fimbrial biogenesis chaperone n=1 Tax=unclassified Pseudomonas TaxID=196821 RepID=UPI002AC978BB|nr:MULTISPECIES: molecular chaperone [unclassified Pseudomonas]MEB0078797.1 molecular chaperone [Pseudomonas sp. MH10out]MEB0089702.1 molecular chaperone [Pseudomonas sp. CCI4.2]MEB0103569.1 molecular chaperone [Pseudomonas sp. CCI3.2]MEB0128991.1 molecular chaperone [Pseudomonas sp. CCI2.4]MEB0160222.1 molecular chaperone [Pseudomonas sp. AH2 (2023)]
MVYTPIRYACLLLALITAAGVQAGIVLNTTRIIYPAQDKEVSFGVHNSGGGEILLQSWLEATAEETGNLPFVITPALTRMPGDGKQLLRIMYAGSDMPQDRESVFWLNVQEIPQTAAANALQIAIRQRIKVFFRPQGLRDVPAEAPQTLRWQLLRNDVLRVSNPGSYHVSMVRIEAHDGATQVMNKESHMLAPKHSLDITLSKPSGDRPVSVSFISINDFGGQVQYRATLNGREIASAVVLQKNDRAPQ